MSEYGVHWNFFLTLTVVSLLATMLGSMVPKWKIGWIGLLVSIVYQAALALGLRDYVMDDSRQSLLDKNKEGVFSILGYLAIFLMAKRQGIAFSRAKVPAQWRQLRHDLVVYSATLYLLHFVVEWLGLETSRRQANFPYVLWIAALTSGQLAGALWLEMRVGRYADSLVLEAVGRNQLAIFLIGNLLTGLVNMTMQTLLVTNQLIQVVIMTVYLLGLVAIALGLNHYQITIRL